MQTETAAPQLTHTVLYLDGVSVSFDGFRALNELSLILEPGEMRAIIGPNGAGKTTMMDVITGKTRPDNGTVLFDGSWTRPRSRSSASGASSRSPRSSRAIRYRTTFAWRSGDRESLGRPYSGPAIVSPASASIRSWKP
jgi:ABC-type molybdenum transport system ATPase subunit/photorepair protein PhrA